MLKGVEVGVKGGMGRVWVVGAVLLGGLAGAWMPAAAQQETIVAIRHGEKLPGGLGQLSCRGLNRSLALPKVLIPRFGRPDAIFAPDPAKRVNDWSLRGYSYVRPLATIEPTAIELGMPVNAQIGFMDVGELEADVTAEKYANAVVYVAWEHAMLNRFAKRLVQSYGGNPSVVPEWPDSDYGRIYVIKIDRGHGRAKVTFKVEREGLSGKLSDACPGEGGADAAPGAGDAHAGARANGLAELPALPDKGIARPAGEAGGLKVLNWAGFSSAVSYTFDDSLASQLANYPQLHATGVRMTFFQVSGPGEKAGWQQAADDGNELGNHTAHHCHADGSGCGWGKWAGSVAAEYDACNEFLKQSYGVGAVWDTASPYGDTGYDATASTMFFLNRGVWNGQIAPDDATDPYNLMIYGAAAGDTEAVFDAHIDEARKAGRWQIFLVHSLGGDGGYAPIDAAGLLASIRHAQAFGDVWLDDMVNIGAYWAGQKAIENGTVTREGGTTTIRWTLPPHFPPGRHVRVTVTGGRVMQKGMALKWNGAGYYEVALDAGELTIEK